jgi:hypothetical protein
MALKGTNGSCSALIRSVGAQLAVKKLSAPNCNT